MRALDDILDGLEAALALERELGVRHVACDRSFLTPPAAAASPSRETAPTAPSPAVEETRPAAPPPVEMAPPADASAVRPFVFLHDRPLSAAGTEMMAKIVAALKTTPTAAPVVIDGPLPAARVHVVLGGNALKKWFPGVHASPGQWVSAPGAEKILVTYSPQYILRFATVTPAVEKIKKEMWLSIKAMAQRARQ